MTRLPAYLLYALFTCSCVPWMRAQQLPAVDGYLSHLESQTRFEVDGRAVEVTEKTTRGCFALPDNQHLLGSTTLQLGDRLVVYGKYARKSKAIRASEVCPIAWPSEKVSGAAVLEKVDGQRLLVDGRLLELTPKSVIKAELPRRTIADAQAGDWVRYTAVAQASGRYQVQELTLSANQLSDRGLKLRDRKFVEFTPPDLAAGRAGSVKFGHLGRGFPLPANAADAARVERVSNSVIPRYQKALASDDPARIDFHFYAIDHLKLAACLSTPNGSVFIPSELLKRLTTDAELAAVLATCVADLIEKQTEFLVPRTEAQLGAEAAGFAAGLVVPGAGLASVAGSSLYGDHLQEELREQSARVSLDLLAAAGYPIEDAPRAWEMAEAKHLPVRPDAYGSRRIRYLYRAVAEHERRGE